MSSALLLLLAACTRPPHVDAVVPAEARPGDAITLEGTDFPDDALVELVRGPTVTPALARDLSGTRLVVDLPDDLPAGPWTLRVSGYDGPTLTVWTPDTEPPCDKRYALDVETHRTQRKVAITRILPSGEPTRHVFLGDQLGALELTHAPFGEATCSALWLIDAEGGRWLMADDTARDLEREATTLAQVLELELRRP